jgi:osmotically-inducible protein OsmY
MDAKITTQLKENVISRLRHDSRLKELPIEVLDYNGVIVLQGEVSSEELSMLAEDLTRDVHGVISVSNELYVVGH